MSSIEERIRVSLDLDVNKPDVDLGNLKGVSEYLSKIEAGLGKLDKLAMKAFDFDSVHPETLQALQAGIDEVTMSLNVARKAGKNMGSDIDMELRMLESQLQSTKTFVNEMSKSKNISVSTSAPKLFDVADTEAQLRAVNKSVSRTATNTSQSISKTAQTSAKVVNSALNSIGSTGEKVFSKLGSLGISTFKSIASGVTNALVHPVSSIKNLESVLLKPFQSLNSLLPKVSLGIRGVTSGLLTLGGVAGLLMLGKHSVQLSSDLEEVQNVVDVVFGNMSKDVNDFAKNLAPAFGEAELQAKRFTSTMGAMLSSMGVTSDNVLVMSENMAALAGDMASFYNIPIEEAFNKIRSGISGETEPLKQLGINMTQASLDAYAMSQGITTSVSKLSQSEQAILRYNYLLSVTANAHGDFARTQFTWANSCRQISMNVQTIFANLGAIVKTVLSPVLTMINLVTGALARMLSLVGAKFKGTTSTATSGMSDLNSQISSASDGLDDVAKSATKAGKAAETAGKKAKLGLASFDQLNNLSSQSSSGSGSSGGSGGSGAGGGAGSSVGIDPNSYIDNIEWSDNNPLTQWMDRFYNLLTDGKYASAGAMCAKSITSGLRKIEEALDSPSLYSKIDDTNMALSNFLRGLVSDQNMWTQVGNTIGSGINIIAFSINDLYANLTANNVLGSLGKGFASAINASLEKVNWASVGSAIVTGIRMGVDIAFNAIMNIDFSSLGSALKTGCISAIERVFGNGGAAEIGGIIAGVINGVVDTVIAWLGDGTVAKNLGSGLRLTITTAINNIDANALGDALTAIFRSAFNLLSELRGIDFQALGGKIISAINTALNNGSAQSFVESALGLVADILNALATAVLEIDWGKLISIIATSLGSAIKDNPELAKVGTLIIAGLGISKALKAIDFTKLLTPLMSNLSGVSSALGGISSVSPFATLISGAGSATGAVGGLSAGLGSLLGVVGIVVAAVAAFVGVFAYLWETSETFRNSIKGIVDTITTNLKPIFDDMKESLSEIGGVLLNVWDIIANILEPILVGIVATLGALFEGIMKVVGGIFDIIAGILTLNPEKIWEGIKKIASGLLDVLTSAFEGAKALLDNIWAKIGDFVTNTATKIGEFFTNLWTSITSFVTNTISSIGNFFASLWSSFTGFISNTVSNVANFFANIWSSFTSFISNTISSIVGFFANLGSQFLNGMNTIKSRVSDGISAVIGFFRDLPSNVAGHIANFVSSVGAWFKAVPDKIKEAFGSITDIGKNLVEGLWNGINNAKDWVLDKIKGFGDAILDGLKDFFGIHSPSRVMRDQVGIFLGRGIGVGIEQSTKDAVASATQMGTEVMGAVTDSIDPDAFKFADMKLSLADVSKTDNFGTTLQNYNSQMDSLISKAQAFRDAMNEVSGKYSLDTLKILLGDYRKVNSGDDTTPQRVVIAGQERVVTVSGMTTGVGADEVMSIVNDNARRF